MLDALDPYTRTMALLFAGVGSVLVVASTVAAVIKWRVAAGRPHAMVDNLVSRINAWWAMVALIGIAYLLGKVGVVALFGLVSWFALREFMSIVHTRPGDRVTIALAFAVALPVQYALVWIDWYGLYAIFIPVYAFLILPIVAALSSDTERFLERTSTLQWGLMISVYCISHVPALLMLAIPGFEGGNALLIAFLVIVVQGSDVLQYIWGKLLGRHKVAPRLSPSKTWEGLVGGVLTSTAIGGALWWVTPFRPWQAAAIAFAICVMGFLGGLVMSAIKRDRGVKDWGTMIRGHGGMLDRLDSVIFAAPVFFHIVRYGWTP